MKPAKDTENAIEPLESSNRGLYFSRAQERYGATKIQGLVTGL